MGRSLHQNGIHTSKRVFWNLPPARLYEESLARGESKIAEGGSLVVLTGQYTGRSPNDKWTIREPSSEAQIWWGDVNREKDQAFWNHLKGKVIQYLADRELFVRDCYVGAGAGHQIPLRVITHSAWHCLFAHNMFVRENDPASLAEFAPEFTVLHAPGFKADPAIDGTRSEAFILMNFGEKTILIGGTSYAGEIKKAMFSVMNYVLPGKGILSIHCSANVGPEGDTALFLGLSGTGKTTLSADPERFLIGDDEHGWGEDGVFNFEGGCYAKVIRLSQEAEPEIFATTRMFGTVLENVVMDEDTRKLDLDSDRYAENTRASYPLSSIPRIRECGTGPHPKNIVMLTCDAFGVLPPIARLTPAQAMYHYVSGYTAKVAGTERGITEPQTTFSACFGAPFLARHPSVYAALLGEKMRQHKAECWLVNTGWSGGPYGTGKRMPIRHTRALLRAALTGQLAKAKYRQDELFGFDVPVDVPGVPAEILTPRNTWADKEAYDRKAKDLAGRFATNFEKYRAGMSAEIQAAGPRI